MRLGQSKHFIYAFVIALVSYVVLYAGLERWRARKGPWQVTFCRTDAGVPQLLISQARLQIRDVRLSFPLAPAVPTNLSETVSFDRPFSVPREMPFGTCVFLDTTFLPGTVTLRAYGHEIELLPRVLVVDHAAQSWSSGLTLELKEAVQRTAADQFREPDRK